MESLSSRISETLDKFSNEIEEVVQRFALKIENQPPPKTIYHYTDSRGFAGIMESGRFRLTDIFGLNDPSELRHGFRPAVKLLRAARREDRSEIEQFSKNVSVMLRMGAERIAHLFICCFSTAGDDLGQWRAYADNGRGFALGFNTHSLEQAFGAASRGHMTFPVTYKEMALRRMHKLITEIALPLISLPRSGTFPTKEIDPYMSELLVRICVPIIRAALFFKRHSYSNESEYRFLQLIEADATLSGVLHLPRGYRMIRYREFDWRSVAGDTLEKIIIGPAADYRKARKFAEQCLRQFHPKPVRIIRSGIPYRA